MNPYETLEERAFWSPAVAQRNMLDIEDLWRPRFPFSKKTRTVTFGSCFAQHFGRALKKNGFSWVSTERPPRGMTDENAHEFNYNIFSARTGNIYTTSLLKQWARWAFLGAALDEVVWEVNGRFYDPFRPNIEPNGFYSVNELIVSREVCIRAFKDAVISADVFVFTMGLTESWWYKDKSGELLFEYPMCPGTVAGEFDHDSHCFVNQDYEMVRNNLLTSIAMMRRYKPGLKFLLTVSPVPLTATNSGNHVLVATSNSKAILRAVAGEVAETRRGIDYFPSYEIINSSPYRGIFFEPNMRSVNLHGVDHVMRVFFDGISGSRKLSKNNVMHSSIPSQSGQKVENVICEEELLTTFGKGRS